MPFWQRLVFTLILIVVTSFVAGLLWHRLLGFGCSDQALPVIATKANSDSAGMVSRFIISSRKLWSRVKRG